MFRFQDTIYLYFLLLIPIFIVFFIFVFKWKKSSLKKFGNLELLEKLIASTSKGRQRLKVSLIILSIAFMVLSLSRPQIGTKLEEVKREGVDIIIALDVSLSMTAEDIKPSRLAKAKHEIMSFIDLLQGDRVGLIAFAGI